MTDVELVAAHDHRVGEGPLWHPEEQRLYWVDIPTGRLFQYDPATDDSEQVLAFDRPLGGCTLQADGSFACFLGGGAVAIWDPHADGSRRAAGAGESVGDAGGTVTDASESVGDDRESDADTDESVGDVGDPDAELLTSATGSVERLVESIPAVTDSRFNDVIADPEGRVFAGTMPTADTLGSLYRVDADGSYRLADDDGYDIPNGMGFTPEDGALYVTESEARTIYRFDYDRDRGELTGKSVFARVPAEEGVPDGLAVDEDGDVWSARWGGGRVVRHAPDGSVVDSIDVPASYVSAVAFGGSSYDDLYVTTARGHDAEHGPPAGSLFRATPDVGGSPPNRSTLQRQ